MRSTVSTFLVLAGIMVLSAVSSPASAESPKRAEAVFHTGEGLRHFRKAFYELTPHKKSAEAENEYAEAIKEYRLAVAIDDEFVDAHRDLARVYGLQKNLPKAIEEYRRVIELLPQDLDVRVQLALAHVELGQYDSAIGVLNEALQRTTDADVQMAIRGYIEKAQEAQQTNGGVQ